jgi:hypothetical protein
MKQGDYSGATGSNIEDDFDSTIADIAGISAGPGPYACSLYIYDGANPVPSGYVRVVNGALEYTQPVDGNGFAVFALSSGTWLVLYSFPTCQQDTNPDTLSVSAHIRDTVAVTCATVGSPAGGANFCSVYVYTYGILGDSLEGATFTAVPKGRGPWIDSNNVAILPVNKTAKTDSAGYAGLAIYRSSVVRQLQPDGTQGGDSLTYDFELKMRRSRGFSWKAEGRVVPDSASWWVK